MVVRTIDQRCKATYEISIYELSHRLSTQITTYNFPTMNRPRNHQQRPPRQQDARPYAASVPTLRQVTPGVDVSIVLKEDQPTGREVQGTVDSLLTRGNHPRGIKVRLTDGRVGRVQRMAKSPSLPQQQAQQPAATFLANYRREGTQLPSMRDVRNEDYLEGPPPRTLFDFLRPDDRNDSIAGLHNQSDDVTFSSVTAKCPICNDFEGDEVAVSHHVETHLT
jgi:uncharacterized repeat protein (TIGR03833 family)